MPWWHRVAGARLAFADQMLGHRSGSLPSLGDGQSKLQSAGTVPMSLDHAWDEPIRIGVQFDSPLTPEMRSELAALKVQIGSETGQIVFGVVPLHNLICVAQLPFVKSIELEHDPQLVH